MSVSLAACHIVLTLLDACGTGGDDTRGPGFSSIAEFAVKSPMLTMSAVVEHENSAASLKLYAVQAATVQQFSLDPTLCAVPAAHVADRTASLSPPAR